MVSRNSSTIAIKEEVSSGLEGEATVIFDLKLGAGYGMTSSIIKSSKVLLGAVIATSISLTPQPSYAVTIGPGNFRFKNPDTTKRATDFAVTLRNPPPFIDADRSTGGTPFPGESRIDIGRNTIKITYLALSGAVAGPGVAPGGFYDHNFVGWPDRSRFDVQFSYETGPNQNPIIVPSPTIGTSVLSSVGQTVAVPEPLTILGSGLALGFGAYFKKEYSRKQKKAKAKA